MALPTVRTARDRMGESVPVLEYNFLSGIMKTVSDFPAFKPLKAGGTYLIVSSVPAFISITKTENDLVGESDNFSIFLAAGLPFHAAVSEDSVLSFAQAGESSGVINALRASEK